MRSFNTSENQVIVSNEVLLNIKRELAVGDHADSVFGRWFGMSPASLAATLRSLADDLEASNSIDDVGALPAVAINSWAIVQRPVPCLIGRTLGHPSIGDGRAALSSQLFYLDSEREIARTMSRWYRLGTRVDPDYWNKRGARRS
ncbi:hypothetical protein N181_22715 [Sinorhizobium fredii USDA 205]|uniref:DUF6634 family protein n=2 Tax=Rhizobium fredii TaxID=380 RepID=UPI000728EB6E|nr:hypothetical protein N181_22715 [Sinorhizobium fredii USDA 205]